MRIAFNFGNTKETRRIQFAGATASKDEVFWRSSCLLLNGLLIYAKAYWLKQPVTSLSVSKDVIIINSFNGEVV